MPRNACTVNRHASSQTGPNLVQLGVVADEVRVTQRHGEHRRPRARTRHRPRCGCGDLSQLRVRLDDPLNEERQIDRRIPARSDTYWRRLKPAMSGGKFARVMPKRSLCRPIEPHTAT